MSDPVADGLSRFERRPDWLLALADGSALKSALERSVPELVSGTLELRECEFQRIRIREYSQTTVHRVTLAGADAAERVLELHGELLADNHVPHVAADGNAAFGTPDWRCHVPELRLVVRAEPAGTAVWAPAALKDPDEARSLLEGAIRAWSPAYSDLRIQACVPRVLGEKGPRTTVLYHLEFPPGEWDRGWPTPVILKSYRRDKSRRVYDAMSDLWSALGGNDAVSIAEPLALLPEFQAVVQGPVPGELTLEELLVRSLETGAPEAMDEVAAYVRDTALALTELHACAARPNEYLDWSDEFAEIQELVAAFSILAPEPAEGARPLLARLAELEGEHPADAPVPSHGSFRSNQVLVDDGAIGFIDFDGFCMAEPAWDIALFRAALKDRGLRPLHEVRAEHLERVDELCELFLASYETAAPVSRARVALWEALDLFTLVLYSWTKLEPGLEHRLELLRRHLRTLPG